MTVRNGLSRQIVVFAWSLLTILSWTTSSASAAENHGCSKATLDWIARADAEIPANVRVVECFPGHVHVHINAASSTGLDVDVALPAGRAFRKIGQVGVSPMIEVPDFSSVPAPQREAFDLLCRWIEKHEMELTRTQAIPIPVLRSIPRVEDSAWLGNVWSRMVWVILCGIISLVTLRAARTLRTTESGRRDVLIFGGLFIGSLLLRCLFGPFGPHHVNGQGPTWIVGAHSDRTLLVGYGPGYYEVFSFLCQAFPTHPDTAIFVANMILSALAAPLLFALARHIAISARPAAWAGAIVALDAISIRCGATESYFTPIITITLAASVFYLWSFDCLQKKPARFQGLGLALLGVMLTVQAARIHPVAWGPLALGPAYLLAGSVKPSKLNPWVWRMGVTCALALLVFVLVVVTSGRVFVSAMGNVNKYWNAQTFVETIVRAAGEYVPFVFVLGIALVCTVKPRGLLVPASASCAALLATRNIYAQSPIWIASYDRLWLAAPLLALSSMIPNAWFRPRTMRFGFVGALLLFFVSGWSTMRDRTTEQLEYSFFRDAFSSMPSDCRVIHVSRVAKRIVVLPEYAAPRADRSSRSVVHVTSPAEVQALLQPGACLRYARTSLCTSEEGRPLCTAVENEMKLVPIVEKDFPAKPSHITSTYDRDRVQVGWFEVLGREL